MIRNLPFIFVLLVTLSIVNAIPHKLNKRVTTFVPCEGASDSPLFTVTIFPDPLVPGGTATFSIQGPLSPPAQTGSQLVIAFFNSAKSPPIDTPFQADLCSINGLTCPLSAFETSFSVDVPAKLHAKYGIGIAVFDSSGAVLGCAVGGGDGGGGKAPPSAPAT